MKVIFSNGKQDSTSHSVLVNILPTLTLSTAPTICKGDTAQLNTTGSATGKFLWTPKTGLSSDVVSNPKAFPTSTTTYTVRITDSITGCFKELPYTVTVNPSPKVSVTGDLTVCPGGSPTTLTASGGVSYKWLPGNETSTQLSVSPTVQTQYSLVATDANGCRDTATVTVTLVSPPQSMVLAIVDRSCTAADGSITVSSVSGGTSPYQYGKNNGTLQVSNTFTGLDTLSYKITVLDSKGCSYDSLVTVGVTSGPSEVDFSTTSSGCGTPTGKITITSAVGGKSPYQYSIDGINYQPGTTFNNLGPGSPQLFVKDANGCIYDTVATVGSLSGPSGLNVSLTADSCGKGNGTITAISMVGGSSPYQYSNDGITYAASATFTGMIAGPYTVYVKDNANCVFSKGVTVPAIVPISNFDVFTTPDSCLLGRGTLSVRNEVNGRTPYSYSLNGVNFQSGNTFTNLAGQHYTVTVKDAGGCLLTKTDSVSSTAPIQSLAATLTASTCSKPNGQAAIAITGGTAPYSLQLDNLAQTTNTAFSGLVSGSHTVSVIDSNFCKASKTFTITDVPGATGLQSTQTPTSCTAPTGTFSITGMTGGTAPYTYSFDSSAYTSTSSFNNLTAGNYAVSVKDNNGCIYDTSITVVTVSKPTVIHTNPTNTTCSNSNGSIDITGTTGGTAPYSYSIDNGPFTATTNYPNLTAKVYTLDVTDVNHCSYQTMVTLTDSPSPTNVVVSNTSTSCGRSLGTLTLGTVTGGTAPFQYSINNAAYTATTAYSHLSGGTYSIVVQDKNGCTDTTSTVIKDIAGPSGLVVTHTDDTCARNSGSLVVVSVNGPAFPFSYSIDGSTYQSSEVFLQVTPGKYTVTVKDTNGCIVSVIDSIGKIDGPDTSNNLIIHSPHCGLADGLLEVPAGSITGGMPPYNIAVNYNKNPSANTFYYLSSGTYTLKITDANGCPNSQVFTLTDIPGPQAAVYDISKTTCSQANGAITFNGAQGGTPPYRYSNDGILYSTNNVFGGLPYGPGQVFFVKDSAGCVLIVKADVPDAPGPTDITAGIVDENCFRGDGQLTGILAVGGTKPVTFQFNNTLILNEKDSVKNLSSGTYALEATDSNGCKLIKTFAIDNLPAPVADYTPSATTGEAPLNISFMNTSTGAAGYHWDFGSRGGTSAQMDPSYYYQDSGIFVITLTAYNKAGCSDSISKTVVLTPGVSLYIPNAFTPDGDGYNDFFEIESYCITKYHLEIFNRWGELITTLTPASPRWDGTYLGMPCKLDVYNFHIISYDYAGGKTDHYGKVTLLR